MPADHLTALTFSELAATVEAVLAGADLDQHAARAGIAPIDLAEAVETFRAAGHAALYHRQERAWYQVCITLPNWATAETTFAEHITPRLDALSEDPPAWWFLRKYPHWRLRVQTTDHDAVTAILDDLVATGTIDAWQPGIYEPESAAFGGGHAMSIIHDLFCADSRGVLTYARQPAPQLGRRELSLLLITALRQHAGLDWFEAGDVFDRVAQMRPAPADADEARVNTLATTMRPLLATPVQADTALFTPAGPVAFAAPWAAGFTQAGQQLGAAATAGRLHRGLRAVLAHIVIFHWNRLGLSAHTQGILAHAATAAILPRS